MVGPTISGGARTRPFYAVVDVGRRDGVIVVVDVRAKEPKRPLPWRYRLVSVPNGIALDLLQLEDVSVALTFEEEEDW